MLFVSCQAKSCHLRSRLDWLIICWERAKHILASCATYFDSFTPGVKSDPDFRQIATCKNTYNVLSFMLKVGIGKWVAGELLSDLLFCGQFCHD